MRTTTNIDIDEQCKLYKKSQMLYNRLLIRELVNDGLIETSYALYYWLLFNRT